MLIGIKDNIALAARNRNGCDLRLKPTLCDRFGSAALRLERERVLFLAANLPFCSEIFCGNAHMTNTEGIGQSGHHHVDDLGIPHSRTITHCCREITAAGHALSSTTDTKITITQHDGLRCRNDRL